MSDADRSEVACPRCGGHALFRDAFEFHVDAPAGRTAQRWGGWHVVERYPRLVPWVAPKGRSSQYLVSGGDDGQGYATGRDGVVECAACGAPFAHVLAWPDDAWWQWSIRGRMLWARDRAHARQILEYVRATDRPARPQSGPLGNLPSHFLSAKVRETVVKAIERRLQA